MREKSTSGQDQNTNMAWFDHEWHFLIVEGDMFTIYWIFSYDTMWIWTHEKIVWRAKSTSREEQNTNKACSLHYNFWLHSEPYLLHNVFSNNIHREYELMGKNVRR